MAHPTLPPDPTQGESRLGPFRLTRPISGGGMARVYEGRLDSLHGVSTRVAIKVIHPDYALEPGFQELFVAEARISARLEHQNLVRIQQFNREGQLLYLVMEYIDGVTFRKMISLARRHSVAVPVEIIAELGRQVCEGLHYAHMATTEEGAPLHLVHRDIKPSNLMLNAQGVVKVLDFGISYAHPSHIGEMDNGGGVKGTWGYMAPEQAEGLGVGPAADLFGLGAVLYELARLEPLFEERDSAEIRRLLGMDEAARRAAALGGPLTDLSSVLVRALQRDPAARFSSAASMGRALGAMVGDPLRAAEGLVQLHRELQRLDGAVTPTERARSVSTVARRNPSQPAGRTGASASSSGRRTGASAPAIAIGSVFAVGVMFLSFGILGFTVWRLWVTRQPEVSPVVIAEPAPAPAPDPVLTQPPPPLPQDPVAAVKEEPKKATEPKKPTEPKEPVRVTPKEPVVATPTPTPPPVQEPEPSTAGEPGTLTIGSDVRAQVVVDGQFLAYTPAMKKVSAGRHTVKLVTEDGRTKVFSVVVPAGGAVNRVWSFDGGE